MKVVLVIAGFDPSAGAGVLADVKAIEAAGCYGTAAITSVTFQNTRGVFGAEHASAHAVRAQAEAILDDFDVAAIKTGMLPTPEIVDVAVDVATRLPGVPLVVDPVMRSTSGASLADDAAVAALAERLVPMATIVTPNVVEAGRLAGLPVFDLDAMEAAGRAIRRAGARFVLVTGGDLRDGPLSLAVDVLVGEGGASRIEGERVDSRHTHGTGCTLASALAARLAIGDDVAAAVREAKRYVAGAIRAAPGLGSGRGPIDHFWELRG